MTADIQHINVKSFAESDTNVNWHGLIPVFHRWIQQQALPEMLIDVADYAHVPAGPGILLIGHEAFYSVDNRANRVGMLYNRRTAVEGTLGEKLEQAWTAAKLAAEKLQDEPELGLRFNPQDVEVFVNDRALAPNTQETFDELSPAIGEFFGREFGTPVEIVHDVNPRGLFRVRVRPAV